MPAEPRRRLSRRSIPNRRLRLGSPAPPPEPATPLADEPGQPTEAFDPSELFRQEEAARSEPTADDLADDIFADPKPPEPEADPLEETPEFLQETPEHDRLWFEQKPPKDFDFDG